jgi:hypothetical protein
VIAVAKVCDVFMCVRHFCVYVVAFILIKSIVISMLHIVVKLLFKFACRDMTIVGQKNYTGCEGVIKCLKYEVFMTCVFVFGRHITCTHRTYIILSILFINTNTIHKKVHAS